jgi:hypothetical protein
MTDNVPSVGPAGPAGCGAATTVLVIVILLMTAFIGAIWWMLRDMGKF